MSDNSTQQFAKQREYVKTSFEAQQSKNDYQHSLGNVNATSRYIYDNQISDALNIVDMFYKDSYRVISVNKKTKVGADGLMIMLMYLMTTHCDDNFILNPSNVLILTPMSNLAWEKDMKDKIPECFRDNVYHHGKLAKAKKNLKNIKNSLIIIDEIDTGNKEDQKLNSLLKDEGIMDIQHMMTNNNRFVVISATMFLELYDLYTWGTELHARYVMEIPREYVGHGDFLEMGVIKEFLPMKTRKDVEKWIDEDIFTYYGDEYRVHIVRADKNNVSHIQDACIKKGIIFKMNTSDDRLTDEENIELFEKELPNHVVICIKGFLRRATLIPNKYKLRIGATHEQYIANESRVDYNVQVQGLPGRMTGYIRDDIERGHKIGPYRTSVKAIQAYEECYKSPYGFNDYQTRTFKKKSGVAKVMKPTMLSAKNIDNLEPVELPVAKNDDYDSGIEVFNTEEDSEAFILKTMKQKIRKKKVNKDEHGFKKDTITSNKVLSLEETLKFCRTSTMGSNLGGKKSKMKVGDYIKRRYVCYEDTNDITTERYVVSWVKRVDDKTCT